jgi:hypothetical protein
MGHVATANSNCSKNYIQNAIRKYGESNFTIQSAATASNQSELDNLERVFIILLRARERAYGYNLRVGGDVATGFHPTESSRKKMSLARQSYKQSQETIAKAAASNRGRKRSAETIAKLKFARKNQPPASPETRQKMAQAKLGKKRPPRCPEYCENIRRAKLGHIVSPEARFKISQSLKKYFQEKQ